MGSGPQKRRTYDSFDVSLPLVQVIIDELYAKSLFNVYSISAYGMVC